MKRVLTLILSLAFVFVSFTMIVAPTFAQEEESMTTQDDWDWEDDWSDDWWGEETATTYDTNFEGSEELGALLAGTSAIFAGGMLLFIIFAIILGLATYIFSAVALMTVAKILGYENGWFAWIPILNIVLLLQMGDMNPLLVLLILIPGIGGLAVTVITVIATMNICEKRGFDKLLGLLSIIPIGNLVLLGMLAWSKKDTISVAPKQPTTESVVE